MQITELFPNSESIAMQFVDETDENLKSKPITKKFLDDISKIDFSIKEVYRCYDIPSFLFTELMKVMELGLTIKKCAHCHNYYVDKGNYHSIYCNHCKKIGAATTYRNKTKTNELIKVYNRLYKKYYARRNKGDFTAQKFLEWSDTAKLVRDFGIHTNMDIHHFTKILDNPMIDFKIS